MLAVTHLFAEAADEGLTVSDAATGCETRQGVATLRERSKISGAGPKRLGATRMPRLRPLRPARVPHGAGSGFALRTWKPGWAPGALKTRWVTKCLDRKTHLAIGLDVSQHICSTEVDRGA